MWKPEQEFLDDNWSQEESVARDTSASDNYKVDVAEKNWKASLKFSKMSSKPEKWWKKELQFSKMREMPWKVKAEKKAPVPLKRTPLAPIGKKKKERLKNEWSEVDVFRERWETGDQCCEVCLKMGKSKKEALVKNAFINWKLIKPQCFPHILSKGLYPRFRLLVECVWLVCWIEHHDIFDSWYRDIEVRNEIEKRLDEILSHKENMKEN